MKAGKSFWNVVLFLSCLEGSVGDEIIKPNYEVTTDNENNVLANPIRIHPTELSLIPEGTYRLVEWNTTIPGVYRINVTSQDPNVAELEEVVEYIQAIPEEHITAYGFLNVSAKFLGISDITITVLDQNGKELGKKILPTSVKLSYQKLNDVFTMVIGIFVAVLYVNMGATLDLEVVKEIAKKPVGPAIGLGCQYLFMPLSAFALGKLFFPGDPNKQLGMFLNGSSPGGGPSNMWTIILGGCLDLSIMMTFVSTVSAFAAVPLWTLTMGPLIVDANTFVIPYKDIAVAVVTLVFPCLIGIAIQKFFPKTRRIFEIILTPLSLIFILSIFSVGLYSFRYIFSLLTYKILIATFLQPLLGYLSGALIAFLLRRSKKEIIAISIETGIQNAAIALFILKFTLPKPIGDLSAVMPAMAVICSPFPLLTFLLIKKTYNFIYEQTRVEEISRTEQKVSISKSRTAVSANGVEVYTITKGRDNQGLDFSDEKI